MRAPGFEPHSNTGGEINAAYERRSIAVTSNIHPPGFDTIMHKTLATAAVDRLLHHAHLVLTKGARADGPMFDRHRSPPDR